MTPFNYLKNLPFFSALLLMLLVAPSVSAAPGWTTKANTLGSVRHGSALLHTGSGNCIYALRGHGYSDFWCYSIGSDSWSSLTSVPSGSNAGAALAYPGSGDFIYASAGGDSFAFRRYSISGNSWSNMSNAPGNFNYGAALASPGSGDFIYALGGGNSNNFWRYNISDNSWTTMTAPPSNVSHGGALVSPGSGDFIYAVSGGNSNNFWRYSISDNSWTAMTAPPGNLDYGAALVSPGSGDFIYALAGGNSTSFWRYSISGNKWTTMSVYPGSVGWGGSLAYVSSTSLFYGFKGDAGTEFNAYEPDVTAPTGGTATDEGQFQNTATKVTASWSGFTDDLSVTTYSFSAYVTQDGSSLIAPTATTDTSMEVSINPLEEGKTIVVQVQALDGSENLSAILSTDGITVDVTAPVSGTVSDDGQYSTAAAALSASWSGFSDASSGISQYSYSIGTTAGDTNIRDWTSVDTATSVSATNLTLTNGNDYFLNVRTVDNAGNISTVVSSNGVTVDSVAPTGGTVADEGATTGNGTQLTATLSTFSEAHSGLAEYSYSIGTSAGDSSIKAWTSNGTSTTITATNLQLVDQQTYFINVKAKDNAGNIGAVVSSDGIKFVADANGPTAGTVLDGGTSTRSNSQLSASWSGFTDASGIAEYSYSIGIAAGNSSVKNWTSTGTTTQVLVTGLSLNFGTTYFFNVRAKDNFGNLSTVVSSNGILVESVGGDMNGDGKIDLDDAKLANSFATGKATPTTAQLLFADVSEPKDGKITTEDANLILRCAKGTIRGNPQYPWCPALTREATATDVTATLGGAP